MSSDDQFPRGLSLPPQSPLFWVAEKDRYLRQLLLRDLEVRTGRRQVVYFTRCDTPAQIDIDDDRLMSELLGDCDGTPIDLILETNGGYTDAAKKLLALLEPFRDRLRVVVPRRAKSNGTLLALAASSVAMGPVSELGPIDPFISLGPTQPVPAHFVLQAPNADPIIKQIAMYAMGQTQQLARRLLSTGQMSGNTANINAVVDALSTRNTYPSHGSVIDCDEAIRLGLRIERFGADDEYYKWVWILRCMYEHDARRDNLLKIFEGRRISNAVSQA